MKFQLKDLGLSILLIHLIGGLSINAQGLENKSGSWVVVSGNTRVMERWSIPSVGILRHHDMFHKYEFSFFRTGISYHIDKNSSITTGVAFLDAKTYDGDGETFNTSQIWFYNQFALKSRLKKSLVMQRWRLENRWIKKDWGQTVNHRIRYRVLYTRPIYQNTYLKSFNEIFVNLNGPFFNQNRFYIGMGQKLSKSLTMDIGYLKNHFKYSDHDVIRMGLTFKINTLKNDVAQLTNPKNTR